MPTKTVIRDVVNRSNDWIRVERRHHPEKSVHVDLAPGTKANFNAAIPRSEHVTENLVNRSIGVSKGDPSSFWQLHYVLWEGRSNGADAIYGARSNYMPPGLYQVIARAGVEVNLVIKDLEYDDLVLEERTSGERKMLRWTHLIATKTEYYCNGPQQPRPPDGVFAAGTRVALLREAGSYCLVQSQEGIEAYVATHVLKRRSA